MSSKVCLLTRNIDPYDHAPEHVCHDMYYGDIEESGPVFAKYLKNAANYAANKDTGWYTMVSVNTETGESKVLFSQFNPKRTRMELNLKAKEAKTAVKRVRAASSMSWAEVMPMPTDVFTTSVASTAPALQSLIDSLGSVPEPEGSF